MREYTIENFTDVNLKKLTSVKMSLEDYSKAHKSLVILCHDVFIKYKNGILLIVRKNYPAKDILWPIGGRVERGMPIEDSLKEKVKNECNLELEDISVLDFSRTFFSTEPFGHQCGTDTFNIVYSARGVGALKLDPFHEQPTIITSGNYSSSFRSSLHPYVKDHLDVLFKLKSSHTDE